MTTVHIAASKNYDVEIAPGLLDSLGEKAAALIKGRTACIVSDDTVFGLYGARAIRSLENAGFKVSTYVFPHGEESKNGNTFLSILNHLADNHLTRSDALIALGGGVTGDMTGFAASAYLRGIAYIQVPTTLLSMVDSSVGGKTAIDLPAGKNLAGAFYQPRYVLCDTEVLRTLPREIFHDGCAEVIKYAVLYSEDFFERLRLTPAEDQLEYVIATCVAMKRDVVAQDEFDTGSRQFLNLGHTFGHAVEAGSNFTLSHGKSVAIGLAMITRAAHELGFCSAETRQRIIALLQQYELPVITDQDAHALVRSALGDKKRQGGTITLVIPKRIGSCKLGRRPVEELPDWIRLCLKRNLILEPKKLNGSIGAIPSKSMAHRLLICAALSKGETDIDCPQTSADIDATAHCLEAMGAKITYTDGIFHVVPGSVRECCSLPCGESGSTLRFLLPVVAALGIEATFHLEGKLFDRPMGALENLLTSHGVRIHRDPVTATLHVSGKLQPGAYHLPGNVSSQFISGLLFAAPCLSCPASLTIDGPLSSASYVEMTLDALKQFGWTTEPGETITLSPAPLVSPGKIRTEGDWSNAAFWLAAKAMGSEIDITGLDPDSLQGDKACVKLLSSLGGDVQIDADPIPDLIPILAVAASQAEGNTHFINARRLRMKESDRIDSTCAMLTALGVTVSSTDSTITVTGSPIRGGVVRAENDHRIAMSAAIASTVSEGPVTILGAEAVRKSYPGFWADFRVLGGQYAELEDKA